VGSDRAHRRAAPRWWRRARARRRLGYLELDDGPLDGRHERFAPHDAFGDFAADDEHPADDHEHAQDHDEHSAHDHQHAGDDHPHDDEHSEDDQHERADYEYERSYERHGRRRDRAGNPLRSRRESVII
jgi:hypothetical protein